MRCENPTKSFGSDSDPTPTVNANELTDIGRVKVLVGFRQQHLQLIRELEISEGIFFGKWLRNENGIENSAAFESNDKVNSDGEKGNADD